MLLQALWSYSTRHKNCITSENFMTFQLLAYGRPSLIFILLLTSSARFVHQVQVTVQQKKVPILA
jgi:hypothetical protein